MITFVIIVSFVTNMLDVVIVRRLYSRCRHIRYSTSQHVVVPINITSCVRHGTHIDDDNYSSVGCTALCMYIVTTTVFKCIDASCIVQQHRATTSCKYIVQQQHSI